ncbi:hypothetical protein [Mycobacterium paraintracellulare]|uniref:hypothetical protein n=1 Tax=Mycobacterium paraintracellulare TaxID=1138383 RepID=UPI001F17334A|nr:hypothetical protein [Mycobacterium paraintracellulare]
MADSAERDLDQNLTRARFRNRNVFQLNPFRFRIEPLSAHGRYHNARLLDAEPGFSGPDERHLNLIDRVLTVRCDVLGNRGHNDLITATAL